MSATQRPDKMGDKERERERERERDRQRERERERTENTRTPRRRLEIYICIYIYTDTDIFMHMYIYIYEHRSGSWSVWATGLSGTPPEPHSASFARPPAACPPQSATDCRPLEGFGTLLLPTKNAWVYVYMYIHLFVYIHICMEINRTYICIHICMQPICIYIYIIYIYIYPKLYRLKLSLRSTLPSRRLIIGTLRGVG